MSPARQHLGKKPCVIHAFVVAAFTASVTDADQGLDTATGLGNTAKHLVVVLEEHPDGFAGGLKTKQGRCAMLDRQTHAVPLEIPLDPLTELLPVAPARMLPRQIIRHHHYFTG
jgi:hypothetical protein